MTVSNPKSWCVLEIPLPKKFAAFCKKVCAPPFQSGFPRVWADFCEFLYQNLHIHGVQVPVLISQTLAPSPALPYHILNGKAMVICK
jgi:hypothetical protein